MNQDRIMDNGLVDLICPSCHGGLFLHDGGLSCRSCNKWYPIIDGIPNICQKDEYWCNVSREKMQELNREARESGDWLKTAKELIPEYLDAIEPFDRADAQFLWPTTNKSCILDAGSMWGGLTLPVAQHCREIFAVDKTMETLEFLKIRAEQMGFSNIRAVAATLQALPFPDGYFDLIILSGVLEWVAFDQEVVLEVHWGKRRSDSATYSKNPRQGQVEVLGEIQRVLKPGGLLHLAIENRFGYQYLIGAPDDHVNIKYVSFLPRFMANAITRWKLNCEYRTYTYSLLGYRSLLKDGGFPEAEYYGVFPHYILPTEIIPVNLIRHWKKALFPVSNSSWYRKIAVEVFPRSLLKYVSPSFIAIAKTAGGEEQNEARIIQLFRKAGLLRDCAPSDIKVVKCGGRLGSYHTANFLVYDKGKTKPAYFCKICRDNRYPDILEAEASNLRMVNKLLRDTELNSSIPKLLYFGTIDSIIFLVTQFLDGEPSGFNPGLSLSRDNLRKLDESIQLGIRFLVKFQKYTQVREVEAASYLLSVIKKQKGTLNNEGKSTEAVDSHIKKLIEKIKTIEGLSMPICAVHGDHDLGNFLVHRSKVRIVDFEHFEPEGLPFFDLATLVFDPILISYENQKVDIPLFSFIDKNNLGGYIHKWLNLYAELSGMPKSVLTFLPQIAALEQQTKEYPYSRDPNTYPMYPKKAFNELISMKVGL
ncbi:methyltransferase domain-containing protein [Chloroflexota bacterium]